jgi:cell division protein FtsI/penicillin-binding protein 2
MAIFLLFLIPISLYPFEEDSLNSILSAWEKKNANRGIVLITSPDSGEIEYAYTKVNAYHKKLPPGSILKSLSSFVFLTYPEKFSVSLDERYFCNGRFMEPYKGFFKIKDRVKYNLIEDKNSGKYYFRCSFEKGHGEVTMREALAQSCNSYYLHFASRNPEFFYYHLINDWKLREGTGASFERAAMTTNSLLLHRSEFESTLASIGDGGELKVTALKVAQIYGAIFADSPILKPILKGETPTEHSPFPYPENMRKKIQQFLRLTVKEGTLKDLKLQNTNIQIIAGKTGTPTQEGKKFVTHGWNIIYFIKENTPFLLVVFTEKGSGKKEALELSRIILNSL